MGDSREVNSALFPHPSSILHIAFYVKSKYAHDLELGLFVAGETQVHTISTALPAWKWVEEGPIVPHVYNVRIAKFIQHTSFANTTEPRPNIFSFAVIPFYSLPRDLHPSTPHNLQSHLLCQKSQAQSSTLPAGVESPT